LRDYYAFTWGDALFVVIDSYWHSPQTVDNQFGASRESKRNRDLWNVTLGEDQYRWLVNVLSTSASRYKFVFSHHILGDVRGGVEWAGLYEWGGSAKNGAYQFDVQRPGWGMPICDLFKTYGVTIFFQGHDHLYVRQEADGVVYQEVTQPASPSGQPPNADAYKSGVILGGTGHLKVTVASSGVTVDYIRSSVNTKGGPGPDNGRIVYSYTIPSAGGR
jgi:hypothetical protein